MLLSDYFSDWDLLVDTVLCNEFDKPPGNVSDKLLHGAEIVGDPAYRQALN